jgi:uncharacterized protein YggE
LLRSGINTGRVSVHSTLIAFASFAGIQASPAEPQAGLKLVPVPARIEVTGYGEVKPMPDVATISYTVRGEGAKSDDAGRAMTALGGRIDAALRGIDAAAEPHTSEVKVAAVRSDDCKEQSYGPPHLSTGSCAISGYVATQSVTLRTKAVKDSGTMIGLVGRAGGLNPQINSFDGGILAPCSNRRSLLPSQTPHRRLPPLLPLVTFSSEGSSV